MGPAEREPWKGLLTILGRALSSNREELKEQVGRLHWSSDSEGRNRQAHSGEKPK